MRSDYAESLNLRKFCDCFGYFQNIKKKFFNISANFSKNNNSYTRSSNLKGHVYVSPLMKRFPCNTELPKLYKLLFVNNVKIVLHCFL